MRISAPCSLRCSPAPLPHSKLHQATLLIITQCPTESASCSTQITATHSKNMHVFHFWLKPQPYNKEQRLATANFCLKEHSGLSLGMLQARCVSGTGVKLKKKNTTLCFIQNPPLLLPAHFAHMLT